MLGAHAMPGLADTSVDRAIIDELKEEGAVSDEDSDLSDNEKIAQDELTKCLYAVREYLKRVPGHAFVSFDALERETGVDLDLKTDVLNRLKKKQPINNKKTN